MKPIKAPAPHGVRLTRDEHGVPHIHATDLSGVYWGMGYCHALDRGMQLCFMRLLGRGRVAELLDGTDVNVEVDKFFRRMNWAGQMDEQVAILTDKTRSLLELYCDGVNARLHKKPPWELRMLGYRLEHALDFKPSYDRYLAGVFNWQGNKLLLNDRPGLGFDLDMDAVKADLHPDWVV